MHRLFQHDGRVFTRTARALGHPFADAVDVSLMPTDCTTPDALERRVDSLLRFDTQGPEGTFLLAVEAQSAKDPDKPGSWAYYVAFLQEKYRLPVLPVVICNDRRTAAWASRPVDFGVPQWPALTLRPLVLGPHNVPVVTDPDVARDDIPLATLSAITHSKDPDAGAILKTLAAALKTVDEDDAIIFVEFTERGLGKTPAAEIWRKIMAADLSFFRSETAQKLRAEGRTEGRTEGRAKDVLLLLSRRDIEVTDALRERVMACTDFDVLEGLFVRAITATSAEELFDEAAPDAAVRAEGTSGSQE
ncbi:hypothetical protein GCM10018987_68920 [Streptomyces cremeus]